MEIAVIVDILINDIAEHFNNIIQTDTNIINIENDDEMLIYTLNNSNGSDDSNYWLIFNACNYEFINGIPTLNLLNKETCIDYKKNMSILSEQDVYKYLNLEYIETDIKKYPYSVLLALLHNSIYDELNNSTDIEYLKEIPRYNYDVEKYYTSKQYITELYNFNIINNNINYKLILETIYNKYNINNILTRNNIKLDYHFNKLKKELFNEDNICKYMKAKYSHTEYCLNESNIGNHLDYELVFNKNLNHLMLKYNENTYNLDNNLLHNNINNTYTYNTYNEFYKSIHDNNSCSDNSCNDIKKEIDAVLINKFIVYDKILTYVSNYLLTINNFN